MWYETYRYKASWSPESLLRLISTPATKPRKPECHSRRVSTLPPDFDSWKGTGIRVAFKVASGFTKVASTKKSKWMLFQRSSAPFTFKIQAHKNSTLLCWRHQIVPQPCVGSEQRTLENGVLVADIHISRGEWFADCTARILGPYPAHALCRCAPSDNDSERGTDA